MQTPTCKTETNYLQARALHSLRRVEELAVSWERLRKYKNFCLEVIFETGLPLYRVHEETQVTDKKFMLRNSHHVNNDPIHSILLSTHISTPLWTVCPRPTIKVSVEHIQRRLIIPCVPLNIPFSWISQWLWDCPCKGLMLVHSVTTI